MLKCFTYFFLGASFFVWLQNYTLWTLPTDGRLLSTWKQLPQHSNKLPSLLRTNSEKEYSGECFLKLESVCGIYEHFIFHSLFVLLSQMFSLSTKSTGIQILKLSLFTLIMYHKLQLNLPLRIFKLRNSDKKKNHLQSWCFK